MATTSPPMTPTYRSVLAAWRPIMRWSRLTVTGLDCLPSTGPVLLAADHDSYWDPVAIAVAAGGVRQIHALAKSTLFDKPFVGAIMRGTGQIPVHRDGSNEDAISTAIDELRNGACIGIFPEGTRSLGCERRARAGIGRLAEAVPEADVVCVRTNGSVDVVRLPTRPKITVEFFRPAGGGMQPGETAAGFADRLLSELREGAPREIPGRRRTAAKYRTKADAGQSGAA